MDTLSVDTDCVTTTDVFLSCTTFPPGAAGADGTVPVPLTAFCGGVAEEMVVESVLPGKAVAGAEAVPPWGAADAEGGTGVADASCVTVETAVAGDGLTEIPGEVLDGDAEAPGMGAVAVGPAGVIVPDCGEAFSAEAAGEGTDS